jgi:hypothetical protein
MTICVFVQGRAAGFAESSSVFAMTSRLDKYSITHFAGNTRNDMPDQNDTRGQLKSARQESEHLRAENARLRAMLGILDSSAQGNGAPEIRAVETFNSGANQAWTPEKKIALFRSLFRGREDVYAVRWERRDGKSGYSPAGVMDWRAIHAARPEERKKVARETRMLQPLKDDAVRDHLTGKQTIGIYPLLPDETCWFLALDFDKKSWMADAAAFAAVCRRFQVPAAVECSRSGKGAHIWLFFDRPVLAANARQLGCALLTQTMEGRQEIGLDSYDRLFPSHSEIWSLCLCRNGLGSKVTACSSMSFFSLTLTSGNSWNRLNECGRTRLPF